MKIADPSRLNELMSKRQQLNDRITWLSKIINQGKMSEVPEHEARIERRTVSAFLHFFRRPREIKTFFRDLYAGTSAYYRAQDVVDLERGELIELISYARKMSIKMSVSSLFLGLLVSLALIRSCHAAEPWTPDNFNWSSLKVAPSDQWNGLYLNLTETPQPLTPEHAALFKTAVPGTLGEHPVLFVSFTIGLAWQAINVAVAAGSIATAIQGCVTTDGSAGSVAGCVFGIAGTVLSIGFAFKAAQSAGWFARAANTWDQSGLELIALDVLSKRAQLEMQDFHEALIADVLRRSFGELEFLGYVSKSHRLAGRDDEHMNPVAPIYRIQHPRHGKMDIASRDHINGTRFTISYANHGLAKRQSFQHERLSDHLMEARFDTGASEADPANPSFDAAGGYQQIENEIACFAGALGRLLGDF
ncbi:hypothetical protein G7Y89_g11734 [Cudoniella acicularis]|uniref:Uncharacterized protein n=1 Tax=Cudoniella acicularis TaxID=354080 RepID=A0A8H4RCQ3_9HELO|nr:hypothetical protein G7Y89_g11734 [Cudoniella acicularis]